MVAAYDQLAAEGYLTARRGAGLFVADTPDDQLMTSSPATVKSHTPPQPRSKSSSPPFRPGAPDLRLFPHAEWARIMGQVWRRRGLPMLAEDDPMGSPRLRRAIAEHLKAWRGLEVRSEDIAVTSGASGALDLAMDAFTRPGDLIACENPGYAALPHLVRGRGLRLAAAEAGPDGVSPAALKALERPQMVIVTPSHQFPLGGALPIGRRRELLAWSAATGAVLVEDDYDSEYRYAGRPLPALASAGGATPVLYVGTFSKVFWTGLRLGFLAAPEALGEAVRQAAGRRGAGASVAAQEPLAAFMESGGFGRHLRRMRRVYAERRRTLLSLLADRFGPEDLQLTSHPAGMHVLARLGPRLGARMTDSEASARAEAAGLWLAPLSRYCFAPPIRQGLLFGFAAFTPVELEQAANRLKAALRA